LLVDHAVHLCHLAGGALLPLVVAREATMLSWSESDPDFVVDPELPERLAAEISDEEYEKKITGLPVRRLAAEVRQDPAAEALWKHATEVLRQGDHYILVMLDVAGGSRLKRWWQFWR
jgi:hypothetical protein